MIRRTYPEMQQIMRRITNIIHKYVPDAEIKMIDMEHAYAQTTIPPYPFSHEKVKIEFNRKLIEHGTWEQIEDSLAHEIAHVLQADRDDLSGAASGWHTEEWGNITRALGGSEELGLFYQNVLFPPRYIYRCADCGYAVNVSERREMPMISPRITTHKNMTGHHKWYVLDETTGRRWTEQH
jgi:predicted SprT family Zn-dependent metalloprotease